MRTLTLLMAMTVFSGATAADPVAPHIDGMSIYFDEEATAFCLESPPAFVGVPAYIVLTHPSTSSSHIVAWEVRVEFESDATFGVDGEGFIQWTYQADATNGVNSEDLIVGTAGSPLPITGAATVLAEANLVWTSHDGYARFTIDRVTGSTTFPEGGGYSTEPGSSIQCQQIFGAWGTPCAWINIDQFAMECPVVMANEDKAWGEVKSLY